MKRASVILSWVVRVCGALQLALGAVIWFVPTRNVVPPHLLSGTILALALFALAMIGTRANVRWPLLTFAILWSVVLPAFGFSHAKILVGPLHWIIRVLHLLMGIMAIGLGQSLANEILKGSGSIVRRTEGVALR